jgi:hypothetical protein
VDPILANIMKVQGVAAAAVFGANNDCLAFTASEPVFEPIMLLAAIAAAEENLDIFRSIDSLADAGSFSCELEHGYFLYRHSGNARLGVMAMTGVNIAMLDVVVGVAALKLAQSEPARQSYAQQPADYSQSHAMSGSRSSASMASTSAMPPSLPMQTMTRSTSNRFPAQHAYPPSVSPLGYGAATGSQPLAPSAGSRSGISPNLPLFEDWHPDELLAHGARVAGAIGPSVMQHVLRALSRYLGGHAKLVIVEELAHLGATPATARHEVFTDFIHNVAERIPDPGLHDEFVKLALGDRR